ncbi:MAG: FAD:protein FMN transferase, partial [Aggregatilineales bacterium]
MALTAKPGRFYLTERQREARNGLLFISPWLIGFLIFVVGPMIGLIWLSFHRWDLIGDPRWVGFRNYERLFRDRLFLKSLEVTVIYGLGRVPLGIIVALGTALLLNNKRIKFIGIWRTIYYMPVVLPPVAIALVWMWIYNPRYGIVNSMIQQFLGVPGPAWLDDPGLVLPSLMIMAVWVAAGRNMIIYLSGLQSISDDLYDVIEHANNVSSTTDGAFDITVGPLVNLWGFGPAPLTQEIPNEAQLLTTMQHIGYEKILLNKSPYSISKSDSNIYIDLSA